MFGRIFDALATLNAVMVASTFLGLWAFGPESPWMYTLAVSFLCMLGMSVFMVFHVIELTCRATARLFGKKPDD